MIERTSSLRLRLLALGALLLVAAPLRAQDVAAAPAPTPAPVAVVAIDSVAPAPQPTGPTLEAATAGVHQKMSESRTVTMAPPSKGYGQATALMIVGGAGLLTGLVVGGGAGYAIAVGGAVVGLIGLYEYLQ
jgi:hypothetical protein